MPATLTVGNLFAGLSVNSVLTVVDDGLVLVALVELFLFARSVTGVEVGSSERFEAVYLTFLSASDVAVPV